MCIYCKKNFVDGNKCFILINMENFLIDGSDVFRRKGIFFVFV